MRIIGGRHRGRDILSPEGLTTRPVTDRVKQALFSHLEACIRGGLRERCVADLFCGTGSMGLESLSRGAAACTFVETDPGAVAILQKNLDRFEFGHMSEIQRLDLLRSTPKPPAKHPLFDVLFVDPPFRFSLDCRAASPIGQLLARLSRVSRREAALPATAVLRVMTGSVIDDDYPDWALDARRKYGTMELVYLSHKVATDGDAT